MTTQAEITVIVADDHPLFRVALRLGVLRVAPAARVIEVESFAALKDALHRDPSPELVLLDLMMPDVEGLSALQFLRSECPDLRVAVVSGVRERAWVRSAEALGAVAFIPKSTPAEQTHEIVLSLLAGQTWWPQMPTPALVQHSIEDKLERLSRQELRILLEIKDGRLNKQIAGDLRISQSTVKSHITALLRKLDLQSRTQAAVLAQRLLAGAS
ncbi:MAG: LuxR C-terminal-related transcriptional regulator [Panacagrimonas sp.]